MAKKRYSILFKTISAIQTRSSSITPEQLPQIQEDYKAFQVDMSDSRSTLRDSQIRTLEDRISQVEKQLGEIREQTRLEGKVEKEGGEKTVIVPQAGITRYTTIDDAIADMQKKDKLEVGLEFSFPYNKFQVKGIIEQEKERYKLTLYVRLDDYPDIVSHAQEKIHELEKGNTVKSIGDNNYQILKKGKGINFYLYIYESEFAFYRTLPQEPAGKRMTNLLQLAKDNLFPNFLKRSDTEEKQEKEE